MIFYILLLILMAILLIIIMYIFTSMIIKELQENMKKDLLKVRNEIKNMPDEELVKKIREIIR